MSTRAFDVLFIDFYGTLAAGDAAAIDGTCQAAITELGLPLTVRELAQRWGGALFAALESSNGASFDTLYWLQKQALEAAALSVGVEADCAPFIDSLKAYCRNPPLHDDALESLARVDVPVCIVSNADDDEIHAALEVHGVRVDAVVTSEGTRSYKPDSTIFEVAMKRMGVAAGRCLHVGDSLHGDIDGARRLGISAAWITRDQRTFDAGQSTPDHTIHSLNEIPQLIQPA